jgi:superfamily I DNA and/or RNA helicase
LRCDVEPAKKLKVAVLSPYSRQVEALKRALDERALPPWLEFSENLSSRQPGSVAPRRKKAYTVDSFQGNQADMVIISMVRNNRRQGPKGLGFLKESERMNVLMSRAEKLLVLVGSWRFFEEQLKDIGVPDDKDDPFWHWLTLLKHLRSGMQRGDVLKLDYPSCFE